MTRRERRQNQANGHSKIPTGSFDELVLGLSWPAICAAVRAGAASDTDPNKTNSASVFGSAGRLSRGPIQPHVQLTSALDRFTTYFAQRLKIWSIRLHLRMSKKKRLTLSCAGRDGLFYLGAAGIPHTLELLGTSRLTSDIAPITTRSPMVMPFCMTDCGSIFRSRSYFINGIDPTRTCASLSGKCVGRPRPLPESYAITIASLELGAADETARVHHAARRRGGVAARGPGAQLPTMPMVGFLSNASPDAGHPPERGDGQSGQN
jgi:hypothetical protein